MTFHAKQQSPGSLRNLGGFRSLERFSSRSNGDGGNRTHVRGRVKDSFYERSRSSESRPSVAAPAGFRGASLLRVPAPPEANGAG